MQKAIVERKEIKLVGITVRTNNKIEHDPMTGKIFPCIQQYFHQNLAEIIPNRTNPGTTFCTYAEYESDHTGEYTYLIGEEVSSTDTIPANMKSLIISPQKYVKFTNGPAPMPEVIRKPWQEIWQMSPRDFGGKRMYHADFEVYDERARDHQNIILDIYIGID